MKLIKSENLKVLDKYTQEVIGSVPYLNPIEIEKMIANSVEAFSHYSKLSAETKRDFLFSIRDELKKEKESFAKLISREAGKPIDYARGEVDRSILVLELAGFEAMNLAGEVVPLDYGIGIGKTALTKRFPIGPILGISPFNFPLNLALHKIAPALAAGCSIILKPSPYTPLSILAFADLCVKAGLPSGVLSIAVCKNEEAELMLVDDRLKMLSFTGSAEIGWSLKEKAKKKKVLLELGGNAAVYIDHSANLDLAAFSVAFGAYNYSGQVCISVQRIFVDDLIYDQFLEKFKKAASELKIGAPSVEGTVVGPLIDKAHFDRINSWIEEAKREGAELLFGGSTVGNSTNESHNIIEPTLLTKATSEMKIVKEEVFGPVAIIVRVKDFARAITEINNSKYGLQAGVFTNQLSQIKEAHDNLHVGAVIINGIPGFRMDSMPYGGVKDSGLGREGVRYAMLEMTETRLLVY